VKKWESGHYCDGGRERKKRGRMICEFFSTSKGFVN